MGGAACSRGAQLAQRRKIQSCVAFFWTLPPFLPPLQLIEPVASSIRFQFRFTGNFSQIEPTLAPSDWEQLEVCFCWLNSKFLHTFQFYFVCHACASWKKLEWKFLKTWMKVSLMTMDHTTFFTKGFVVLTAIAHVDAVGVAVTGKLIFLFCHPVARGLVALDKRFLNGFSFFLSFHFVCLRWDNYCIIKSFLCYHYLFFARCKKRKK